MRTRVEREMHAPMVWLALVFLCLMTVALPHTFAAAPGEAEATATGTLSPLERATIVSHAATVGLVILAIPFWVEAIARLAWIERGSAPCRVPRARRMRKFHIVACALVPPLRPGLSPATMPARMWLPGVGWRRTSRNLSKRVQKAFSIPMLCIGLLILPVLGAEFLLADLVHKHEGFALGLDIATRLIWFAFALEFLIMLAVEPRQIEYATRHWVDLVIILLPFAAFLRSLQALRAAQVMRAGKMTKLASTYRLRGLAVKLMQAIFLLRVLENLSGGYAKRRILKVRETIERRREEIAEMEADLREMRHDLAVRLWNERRARRGTREATSQS